MSFFDGRPNDDELPDDEPELVAPPWFGPPAHVLPGISTQRRVLFRTAQAALMVDRFEVYATGVTFTMHLLQRRPTRFGNSPMEVFEPRYRPGDHVTDDVVRLGLLLADGTSWSNIDRRAGEIWDPTVPPEPPFVTNSGGGGNGTNFAAYYWLWPLPPPGKLTFIVEWPAGGVAETRASVDADEPCAAAALAGQLW